MSCDGTDATIVANAECYVPMTTIIASPFSLDIGDSFFAKLTASNEKGESVSSS